MKPGDMNVQINICMVTINQLIKQTKEHNLKSFMVFIEGIMYEPIAWNTLHLIIGSKSLLILGYFDFRFLKSHVNYKMIKY